MRLAATRTSDVAKPGLSLSQLIEDRMYFVAVMHKHVLLRNYSSSYRIDGYTILSLEGAIKSSRAQVFTATNLSLKRV